MTVQFAHIGLHKTATTWLQTVFAHHPGLQVIGANPTYRDLAVQITTLAAQAQLDLGVWQQTFKISLEPLVKEGQIWGISDEQLSGHMITGYNANLISNRLLKAFGPIKILLVLRHPVEFIRSMYVQYVKQGGALPFRAFLRDTNIPGKAIAHKINYPVLVNRYRDCFGAENVLVLPYELMAQDSARFWNLIWTFLDVEPVMIPSEEKNASFSSVSLHLMRMANYAGVHRRTSRQFLTRLDRVALKKVFRQKSPQITVEFLREVRDGGPIYPGFSGLLRDENYRIWDGELVEFNYKF